MNKEDQKLCCAGMWGHFLECGHEGPGGTLDECVVVDTEGGP